MRARLSSPSVSRGSPWPRSREDSPPEREPPGGTRNAGSETDETVVDVLDRPDLPPVGAGETPVIAVAPAIANAVFAATGVRIREMPIRWPGSREGV